MRRHVLVLTGAIILFGFLLLQDVFARLAWQKYRSPQVALALIRKDEKLAMSLGNYYFNGGAYDLKKAKQAYQKALSVKPGILWGHYQLARIAFMGGDYDAALKEIDKELEANPENLRSFYVRGLMYGYRGYPGDLSLAEADFRRFTLWAPKEWAGHNDLAWVLSKQRKYGEAEETIQTAFRKIPDIEINTWLWNSLGVAQLNLKKYAEAERSFKKAKEFSESITQEEWREAYPGNDPASTESGLLAFKKAIDENLLRSVGNHVENSL